MPRYGPVLKLAVLRLLLYPHRLIPGALARHGARPAFADGTTFSVLLARVRRLAGHWARSGLAVGDRLVIDLPNDSGFVEARLAAMLAGLVAVPVPPGVDDARLGWIAEFSEAKGYLGARGASLPGLASVHLDPLCEDRSEYEAAVTSSAPLPRSPRLGGDHVVTINFTSGTTGEPKGVVSTARGWGWSLYWALRENRVPVGGDEVFLHAVPLATAGSALILPAVLSGAKSLFLRSWDAGEAARVVEEERVTRIFLTPSMLAEFLDAAGAARRDLSSLRSVVYGTEGIPAARVRKAFESLGPVLQQGYGMAEALPPVALLHPDEHRRAIQESDVELLSSAGRPTGAVSLRITGEEGEPLQNGQTGSIRIRGKTVSPGYWRRPDLTAAARDSGYYVTGDLGFLDRRGYLFVRGRAGRIPGENARALVEWAEGRADVCIAWAQERESTIELSLVPTRGHSLAADAVAREAQGRSDSGKRVRVSVHPKAPLTPSYKLAIDTGIRQGQGGAGLEESSRSPRVGIAGEG